MTLAIVVQGAVFSTTHLIVWLIIGLLAGFLATRVVRGPTSASLGISLLASSAHFLQDSCYASCFPIPRSVSWARLLLPSLELSSFWRSCASLQGRRAVHRRSCLFLV